MRKLIPLLTLALLCHILSYSQPRLLDRPMQLKSCSVTITADPFTATTFMELEFYNPNEQEMEGLYTFHLNPGQALTAFQLDLNGKYRDGSIEEKWKARNAYNTVVGKRIDPALLQMNGNNQYSLNIYPLAPKGTRKVTMTVQQVLKLNKDQLEYSLPLQFTNAAEQFHVRITVSNSQTNPFITEGLLLQQYFAHSGASHQLEYNAQNLLLNKPIAFAIPLLRGSVSCVKQQEGKSYFAIRHTSAVLPYYPIHPKELTVYWDISASGARRNVDKEINFLKQYIAYHKIGNITISTFNYKVRQTQTFNTATGNNWVQYLRAQEYDGATQLGSLNLSGKGGVVMIFSDGHNSYGKALPASAGTYVYFIHASPTADAETINSIVEATGGSNIDLQVQSISEAIAMAGKARNSLLSIRSASGQSIIDTYGSDERKNMLVAGTFTGQVDTILFTYGNVAHTEAVEKVVVSASTACGPSSIDRIPELSAFDDVIRGTRWQEALQYGRQYRIVTPNTSFIVLERVEDYIRFNIEPPKELQEECERRGFVTMSTRDKLNSYNSMDQYDRLNNVMAYYNDRIRMMGERKELVNLQPEAFKAIEGTLKGVTAGVVSNKDAVSFFEPAQSDLSDVVVVGYGASRRREMTYSVTTVRSNALQSSALSVEQALEGRVAGVQVMPASPGVPGGMASIRIRGLGTIGNAEPLYVLDGVPVTGNINDMVSVQDIESIDVLKSPTATALYGSRGASGVIVINTKKGSRPSYYGYSSKPYRLKDMEDVEYLQELKQTPKEEKLSMYRALQVAHGGEAGFYLDVAQHFFETGLKEQAFVILTNAAEAASGNVMVLKAVAYTLEQWKEWEEAIRIYEQIRKISPFDPSAHRGLARACEQEGRYQQAIDVLYEAITLNYESSEQWMSPVKAMMLQDLNAILSLHKTSVDTTYIPKALVRPLPVDLRIVIETNGGSISQVQVTEPGGAVGRMYGTDRNVKGRVQQYGYGTINEYTIAKAEKGRYRIQVQYYDAYKNSKAPAMIKLTVYKNFGRPGQLVTVENVILDNQNGMIEIGDVKW